MNSFTINFGCAIPPEELPNSGLPTLPGIRESPDTQREREKGRADQEEELEACNPYLPVTQIWPKSAAAFVSECDDPAAEHRLEPPGH